MAAGWRRPWLANSDAHSDLYLSLPLDQVILHFDKVGFALGFLGEEEERIDVVILCFDRLGLNKVFDRLCAGVASLAAGDAICARSRVYRASFERIRGRKGGMAVALLCMECWRCY